MTISCHLAVQHLKECSSVGGFAVEIRVRADQERRIGDQARSIDPFALRAVIVYAWPIPIPTNQRRHGILLALRRG